MDRPALNRLLLCVAYAVNVRTTYVAHPGLPMDSLIVEALGLTLACALPAIMAYFWLKEWRLSHSATLVLAVLVALGT
jgi:hypothetical protein